MKVTREQSDDISKITLAVHKFKCSRQGVPVLDQEIPKLVPSLPDKQHSGHLSRHDKIIENCTPDLIEFFLVSGPHSRDTYECMNSEESFKECAAPSVAREERITQHRSRSQRYEFTECTNIPDSCSWYPTEEVIDPLCAEPESLGLPVKKGPKFF